MLEDAEARHHEALQTRSAHPEPKATKAA